MTPVAESPQSAVLHFRPPPFVPSPSPCGVQCRSASPPSSARCSGNDRVAPCKKKPGHRQGGTPLPPRLGTYRESGDHSSSGLATPEEKQFPSRCAQIAR